jgi:Ca2+/Na+ antiporter
LIRNAEQGGYANAILMFGLAATFAVIWLRHAKEWAKVVTIVLALVAVASIFFASYTKAFWPVAVILAGGYLLYTALRPESNQKAA